MSTIECQKVCDNVDICRMHNLDGYERPRQIDHIDVSCKRTFAIYLAFDIPG
jgi:hypothetical protein